MRNLLERSDITKRREESVLCIRTPTLVARAERAKRSEGLHKRSAEAWGCRLHQRAAALPALMLPMHSSACICLHVFADIRRITHGKDSCWIVTLASISVWRVIRPE